MNDFVTMHEKIDHDFTVTKHLFLNFAFAQNDVYIMKRYYWAL